MRFEMGFSGVLVTYLFSPQFWPCRNFDMKTHVEIFFFDIRIILMSKKKVRHMSKFLSIFSFVLLCIKLLLLHFMTIFGVF